MSSGWYAQPAVVAALISVPVSAVVATAVARVQVVIARENRLWQERKDLYLDLLQEARRRQRVAGEAVMMELDGDPVYTTPEEREAYERLSDRRMALASRQVNDLDFEAEQTAVMYAALVVKTRREDPQHGFVPGAGRKEVIDQLRERWVAAEGRLIMQIRAELSYDSGQRMRRLFRWTKRQSARGWRWARRKPPSL
jgi:hypothetical protein